MIANFRTRENRKLRPCLTFNEKKKKRRGAEDGEREERVRERGGGAEETRTRTIWGDE
jgi:hypothetical protein